MLTISIIWFTTPIHHSCPEHPRKGITQYLVPRASAGCRSCKWNECFSDLWRVQGGPGGTMQQEDTEKNKACYGETN